MVRCGGVYIMENTPPQTGVPVDVQVTGRRRCPAMTEEADVRAAEFDGNKLTLVDEAIIDERFKADKLQAERNFVVEEQKIRDQPGGPEARQKSMIVAQLQGQLAVAEAEKRRDEDLNELNRTNMDTARKLADLHTRLAGAMAEKDATGATGATSATSATGATKAPSLTLTPHWPPIRYR